MKGIIQMTILEALVHLYQKLRRCCRHNNIKILFPVLLFYLQGLGRELFSLSISFFCGSKFLQLTHRHARWHTNNLANNTRRQTRETAKRELTWKILTGRKKSTPHMTLNLLLVLLDVWVIIHIRGLQLETPLSSIERSGRRRLIQGRHLRCEGDIRPISIKKIISQDHSGHKESGQPSPHDWMSPHMLGLWLTSRTSPF